MLYIINQIARFKPVQLNISEDNFFFYFTDVTLQILQQAEDQLRNASSSQPSNKHMEKRAIQGFGYLNPQDVPQMMDDTQQGLLG